MTVHRTKLLAAAVLLAGGLSSVVGTGLLAGPQPPTPARESAPPSARPAAGDTLPPVEGVTDGKPVSPVTDSVLPVSPESDPARPSIRAGGTVVESGPARRWQYDFLPARPVEAAKLVEVLRDREVRGWEFVGQVTLLSGGKDAPHWAFRRAPDPAAPPGGADLTPFNRENPILPPTLQPAEVVNPAGGYPEISADRAKEQDDRIRQLESEVRLLQEALKKQLREVGREAREEVVIPAKEVGLAPGEMLGVLVKLADQRFGPDARRRLELVADARGLTVRGDAEAVRWARELVKQANGR